MGFSTFYIPSDASNVGSSSITTTTAGTTILVPSTATGAIYITSLLFSNGATASTISLGYGVAAVAPTTTAILVQPVFMAVNSSVPLDLEQPFKVPALNNVLVTDVGGSTMSATVTWYVAP